MNVERAHFRRAGRDHILTTKPCVLCGRVARLLDMHPDGRIDHTCESHGRGPSWTVYEPVTGP